MRNNLGCCGSVLRVILMIINLLFLLIGLAVFIIASIIKWSPSLFINKITNNPAVNSILNITVLDDVSIALLVIGGFIILLSLIGLLGVCFSSKFFLILYEIIIIILFLAHGITLLVVIFSSGTFENAFKQALNNTMDTINDPATSEKDLNTECTVMNGLSEIFKCCGANSRHDFLNKTLALKCCVNGTNDGCSDRTIKVINDNAVSILFLPNGVILVFELILILLVPFFLNRIKKSQNNHLDDTEKLINDEYAKRRYGGRY